jgi:hypothetical protein
VIFGPSTAAVIGSPLGESSTVNPAHVISQDVSCRRRLLKTLALASSSALQGSGRAEPCHRIGLESHCAEWRGERRPGEPAQSQGMMVVVILRFSRIRTSYGLCRQAGPRTARRRFLVYLIVPAIPQPIYKGDNSPVHLYLQSTLSRPRTVALTTPLRLHSAFHRLSLCVRIRSATPTNCSG